MLTSEENVTVMDPLYVKMEEGIVDPQNFLL